MTKTEALKLVFTVKAAYPVYYRNVSDREYEAMADLWMAVLDGYTYDQAFVAIQTYLRSGNKEMLQSPGQIVDEIERLKAEADPEKSLTPAEAWAIVRPAIRDSYYHGAEHFEEFPDIVKEAVGDPDRLKEWGQMGSETVDSVIQSNFCNKIFPAVLKRHKDHDRLPVNVAALIDQKREERKKVISIERAEKVMIEPHETPEQIARGRHVRELREAYERRKHADSNDVYNAV